MTNPSTLRRRTLVGAAVALGALAMPALAQNNTVVIIEHNLDIIRFADWIIDMGPDGGKNGGEILFEGIPEDLMECNKSYTGISLRKVWNSY